MLVLYRQIADVPSNSIRSAASTTQIDYALAARLTTGPPHRYLRGCPSHRHESQLGFALRTPFREAQIGTWLPYSHLRSDPAGGECAHLLHRDLADRPVRQGDRDPCQMLDVTVPAMCGQIVPTRRPHCWPGRGNAGGLMVSEYGQEGGGIIAVFRSSALTKTQTSVIVNPIVAIDVARALVPALMQPRSLPWTTPVPVRDG
jgi:hypothetical protein